MSALNELIAQIPDDGLRQRIEAEVRRTLKHKKFGLVFEEHLPETAYLPDLGREVPFGEPIYPYLELQDTIPAHDIAAPAKGPRENWHTLIEADNYHALQLLQYLYAGQVDCIYIDPPYNTGARDWKYNNDYVDGADQYRHSKWLSFMKRRLLLAKKLLNPACSVLIVTIDEKEYLHLGCLLEEIFPDARRQMVTSVISAKGVVRTGQFSRVEEYLFIIEFGSSNLIPVEYNMLDTEIKKESNRHIEWLGFRRRAPQAIRHSRPNQFYPIFVSKVDGKIHSIGEVLQYNVDRHTVTIPDGCVALWPLSSKGDERLWSLQQKQAIVNWGKGYIKVNWDKRKEEGTVYYLPEGTIKDIESGIATKLGYDEDGSIQAIYYSQGTTPPKRVWNMPTHNAETYGTNILNSIIGKRFDFPKSLYAVRDTLKFFVADKKNALIVDFFAGSGTTLHAVNLLNAEDGGHRRCIMVTNNEVSDAEAKALTKQGHKQGDAEWERLGIARYVTWPRTVCSILGRDINGQLLKGNYLGTERAMADGFDARCAFFRLGFLDKTRVALGRQFRELLPLLWMKAGCHGAPPVLQGDGVPPMLVLPENAFAVLVDRRAYARFVQEVEDAPGINTVFFVTDSETMYREMAARLSPRTTFQLYKDYLDNFRINRPQ